METNNFVKSWHNQLKTGYLGRKKNRRIDRLVWILANDVGPDYINNLHRIKLNAGRMGPEQRRVRTREMKAEVINDTMMIDQMINMIFILVNGQNMASCTCQDFVWNTTACKHMYLLKRWRNNLAVYRVAHNIAVVQMVPPHSLATIATPAQSQLNATVVNNAAYIISVAHLLRNGTVTLNEKYAQRLQTAYDLFNDIESLGAGNAPNSELTRQRR
ncbi:hypothetical protein MUCCIDRAFT_112436 [Mucor lusitanicus CBS 277.49]|uniref:SWIM-type domain-containing protein n=1 Tax=Mucor lusitanicus CBS 277.49 TaxID=747725 RepID=A0A162QD92_MUCCL|nr:hypothetical protein MUCCIDRAFT_112436 [Mucor lusitanicus CBS 277.49]